MKIIKQASLKKGCLPACASSVLVDLGLSAPSESRFIDAMQAHAKQNLDGSGFECMRDTVHELVSAAHVHLLRGDRDDLRGILYGLTSLGFAPIVAHQNANPNDDAHIVVVPAIDLHAGTVTILDPWPGIDDERTEPFSWLRDRWCGDVAVIRRA